MNSDLSCHELSKPRREGQGGDDQRYYGGKDQPAGRENRKKDVQLYLIIKQKRLRNVNTVNPEATITH